MMRKPLAQNTLSQDILLTSEQLYSNDVRARVPISVSMEQRRLLVGRVRAGDRAAREEFIHALLPILHAFARRLLVSLDAAGYPVSGLCVLDLIGEGHLALLSSFDRAISEKDWPCAYLIKRAHYAMSDYCRQFESPISIPAGVTRQEASQTRSVSSLDRPLFEEEDLTLADLLVAPPICSGAEVDTENYQPLYQAVGALAPHQQEVIIRFYGLFDSPCQDTTELGREAHTNSAIICGRRATALARLYERLQQDYPELAHQNGVYIAPSTRKRETPLKSLSPEQIKRLDQAYEALQERGEKITVKSLQKEAHVSGGGAESYLNQRRQQVREPERGERLEQSYRRLQEAGERIDARRLAKEARTARTYACSYLRQIKLLQAASSQQALPISTC